MSYVLVGGFALLFLTVCWQYSYLFEALTNVGENLRSDINRVQGTAHSVECKLFDLKKDLPVELKEMRQWLEHLTREVEKLRETPQQKAKEVADKAIQDLLGRR